MRPQFAEAMPGQRLPGAEEGPGHVDVEGAPPGIRPAWPRRGEGRRDVPALFIRMVTWTEFAAHPLETG